MCLSPPHLQHVSRHDRFERVELQLAIGASHGDSDMVAHYLSCHHCHSLTLRWVHLACSEQQHANKRVVSCRQVPLSLSM